MEYLTDKRIAVPAVVFCLLAWVCTPVQASSSESYERGVSSYMSGDYQTSYEAFKTHRQENPDHKPTLQWLQVLEPLVAEKTTAAPTPSQKVPPATPASKQTAAPATTSAETNISEELQELRALNEKLSGELKQQRSEAADLRHSADAGQAEINRLLGELERSQKELVENSAEFNPPDDPATVDALRRENADLRAQLQSMADKGKSEYQSQVGQLEEVSALLRDAEQNYKNSDKARAETQRELENSKRQNAELSRRIQNAQAALQGTASPE